MFITLPFSNYSHGHTQLAWHKKHGCLCFVWFSSHNLGMQFFLQWHVNCPRYFYCNDVFVFCFLVRSIFWPPSRRNHHLPKFTTLVFCTRSKYYLVFCLVSSNLLMNSFWESLHLIYIYIYITMQSSQLRHY